VSGKVDVIVVAGWREKTAAADASWNKRRMEQLLAGKEFAKYLEALTAEIGSATGWVSVMYQGEGQ
jgi:hypothetical protein